MISFSIKPGSGKTVNLRVPEDGTELPLNRYFYAKYLHDKIKEYFVSENFDQFKLLGFVIEYISQVCAIEKNDLAGFRTGSFRDNFQKLEKLKDKLNWENIEGTLYELYVVIAFNFENIVPNYDLDSYEFKYRGELFEIPKVLGDVDLWSNEPMPDMPTWMGIKCCELQRQLSNYIERITPKEGKISLDEMTEEEQDEYFNKHYNCHLSLLSTMVNKKGHVDMRWMQGQEAIDKMIEQRMVYFKDIDTQTALNCFFFGLNITRLYAHQTLTVIGGTLQSLLLNLLRNER